MPDFITTLRRPPASRRVEFGRRREDVVTYRLTATSENDKKAECQHEREVCSEMAVHKRARKRAGAVRRALSSRPQRGQWRSAIMRSSEGGENRQALHGISAKDARCFGVGAEKSRPRLECVGPSRRFAGVRTLAPAAYPHGAAVRHAESGPLGNRTPHAGASDQPPSQPVRPIPAAHPEIRQ